MVGLLLLPPLDGIIRLPWDIEHYLSVVLICAFSFFSLWPSWRPALGVLLTVYLTVTVAEAPFWSHHLFGGHYQFRPGYLGPSLPWDRPLALPMAWYGTALPSLEVARSLLFYSSKQGGKSSVFSLAALGALLTTMTDMCADVILSSTGSISWKYHDRIQPDWVWRVTEGTLLFHAVPIRNFFGWFCTAFIFFYLSLTLFPQYRNKHATLSTAIVQFCIGGFYVAHPVHPLDIRIVGLVGVAAPALGAVVVHLFHGTHSSRRM